MTISTGANPYTMLLAEDDDGDALAVLRAFHKAKIANRVVRAVDGIEALEMLRGENGRTQIVHPHLLLVDLNMPRMNGIELVQALRADENLRRTLVFILTTSKRDEDRIAAYDLNVAGYITKANAATDFLNLVSLMEFYFMLVEVP